MLLIVAFQFMTKLSVAQDSFIPILTKNYDFSNFKQIVDVGGGEGGLLSELLRVNKHTTGIVYDLVR